MRKKYYKISTFEVLLCLFVIMIHLLSECISGYEKGSFLCAASFILSRSLTFAVPAFIMLSGAKLFCKFSSVPFNYGKFIKSRVTKIYIPYIIWVLVYCIYFSFYEKYFPFSLKMLGSYILNGEIAAPFYFIVVMMQFYILFPVIMHICKKFSAKIVLPVCLAATIVFSKVFSGFLYSDRIFLKYLIYFVIGAYIGLNYDNALRFLSTKKLMLIVSSIFFVVCYDFMSYLEFMGKFHSFLTELVKMFMSLTVPLSFLIVLPEKKYVLIGKTAPLTYYVYLIHCLLIFISENLLTQYEITSISLRFAIKSTLVYVLSFAFSGIYHKIKKSIKT